MRREVDIIDSVIDSILDPLFEPLEMSNLTLKNRFYMAPMGTVYSITQMIDYLVARARGEVALITTGEASVHCSGRAGGDSELIIETDDDIRPLSLLAQAVHKAGAKIVLQLNHAGRYSPGMLLGRQAVAPSPIMSGYTGETPRELSTEEVDDLVIAFAEAALRARKAGFDGIEFLGSSGYLISQFLSPLTNRREDRYGGDAIQRTTFLLSILREARKRVGEDFNVCVKFDAEDGMKGGKTLEDSRRIAPLIVKSGADRLHIWAGWHEATKPMLPMFVPRAAFSNLASAIKEVVDVPISAVGRINDPYVAATILERGEADLIGLGRALLADPEFVKKTMEGHIREIRRCTACCYCFDRLMELRHSSRVPELKCGINPELGREGERLVKPTKKERNVVVIGGGPSGMEAARVASIRGHRVMLYERNAKLGGMLNISSIPPHKEELMNLVDYYEDQMDLLNVEVRLESPFSLDELERVKPDVFIIATGASASMAEIPGISDIEVSSAIEVLEGRKDVGDKVAIIGGGMIGLETAEYLADKGKGVTVIEKDRIASDVGQTSRWGLISRLRQKMTIMNSAEVVEVKRSRALVIVKNKKQDEITFDDVVISTGLKSDVDIELIDAIDKLSVEYYLVGSCKETGQLANVIEDAFKVGCII